MQTFSHAQVEYAGFFRRLFAFMLDLMILSALSSALIVLVYGWEFFVQLHNVNSLQEIDWSITAIEQLFPALWTIGFWITWMATPGKLLFDCQVVDARTLRKAGTGQLLIRYLAYILSTLPLGLGFLWILWDRRKQGWHDKLAKTVVIMQDDSRLGLEVLA